MRLTRPFSACETGRGDLLVTRSQLLSELLALVLDVVGVHCDGTCALLSTIAIYVRLSRQK